MNINLYKLNNEGKKMRKYISTAIVSGLVAILASTSAFADNFNGNTNINLDQRNRHTGWYASVNGGVNAFYAGFISTDTTEGAQTIQGFGVSVDTGYNFTKHTALEGGLIYMHANGKSFTGDDSDADAYASVYTPYLAARFTIPIGNRFAFLAKTGLMLPFAVVHDPEDGTKDAGLILPFIGLGGSYAITRNVDFTVLYQGAVYGVVGAGLLSGGITYHFS